VTAPRAHRILTLLHLDGRPWSSAGFAGGLPSDAWAWVAETVAREWACDEDDVHCEESENGDLITVAGRPAYLLSFSVDKLH
jgi:hypothetical protein